MVAHASKQKFKGYDQNLKITPENILRWQNDWCAFMREVIGFYPNEDQEKIIKLAQKSGSLGAVKSGHGVGKTSVIASIGLLILSLYTDAGVVVTQPSAETLEATYMKELNLWHNRMHPEFRQKIMITQKKAYRIGRKDTFLVTRTVGEGKEDALQGFHAYRLFFLIDEAAEIASGVFEVAFGTMTTEIVNMLLTGNPTNANKFFGKIFVDNTEGWETLTLSSETSSNVIKTIALVKQSNGRKKKVEGFEDDIRKEYGKENVEIVRVGYPDRIKRQYGKDSDEYRVRVLGEFPLANSSQFISREVVKRAADRYQEVERNPELYNTHAKILGVDVSGSGDDYSSVYLRQGIYSKCLLREQNIRTTDLAARVAVLYVEFGCDAVCVDGTGVGVGVYEYLFDHGYNAISVIFGSSSSNKRKFYNKRSEIWSMMKDWLIRGGVIEDKPELIKQLSSMLYEKDEARGIKLMSKKIMRQKGYASPDDADAIACTFAENFAPNFNNSNQSYYIPKKERELFTV